MENIIFNDSLTMTDHSRMVLDSSTSHMFPDQYIHSPLLDPNSQRQLMATDPLFSSSQEVALNNLCMTSNGSIANAYPSVSRYVSHTGDVGDCLRDANLSTTSLTNLLSSITGLQENLNTFGVSASPSTLLSDELRTSASGGSCNNFSSSRKDADLSGQLDCRWSCDEILGQHLPSGRTTSTVRPSYHVIGNPEPGSLSNKAMDYGRLLRPCTKNELSLSLGSCHTTISMPTVPDQSSEVSCSGITQVTSKDTGQHPYISELQGGSHVLRPSFHDAGLGVGLGSSQQAFPNGEGLALFGVSSTGLLHFPHVLVGSRYLNVAQEILGEIACYAFENSSEMDDSLGEAEGEVQTSVSSTCSSIRGLTEIGSDDFPLPFGEVKSQSHIEQSSQQQDSNTKKSELLSILLMVDRRYNQYSDQIRNIISAFCDATGSHYRQLHAHFALHMISALYKSLRERIANQILLLSQHPNTECTKEKEKTFESSLVQRQWALQQLKRNDQQSWRPQRGLPERSVSVLRAWMFQNFLHPYPKDNEKQLLAMKSGLTRSQVSNWFINARVRLWKPMIEEMYSELNRRNQQEGAGDCRSHGNLISQRLHMN